MVSWALIMAMPWQDPTHLPLGPIWSFSNGAQIMIDQYISAAEDKWRLQNGIVSYCSYEGQGRTLFCTYGRYTAVQRQYVCVYYPTNYFQKRRQLLENRLFTRVCAPSMVLSTEEFTAGHSKSNLRCRQPY